MQNQALSSFISQIICYFWGPKAREQTKSLILQYMKQLAEGQHRPKAGIKKKMLIKLNEKGAKLPLITLILVRINLLSKILEQISYFVAIRVQRVER